jgi:hypothetical protein
MPGAASGIRFAKDLRLNSVVLKTPSGFEVNLFNLFEDLNIYEDITENTLTGDISIVDALNLPSIVPIVGEETIEIEFKSPQYNDALTLSFDVSKISDRHRVGDRAYAYVIHFCSPERLSNLEMSLSRGFNDTSENLIQGILTDDLQSDKILQTHTTKFTQQGVIPSWRPLYFINWLCSRSVDSATQGASFVFFENKNGFVFDSLEHLSQAEPKQNFVLGINNIRNQSPGMEGYLRLDQDICNVESYTIISTFDQVKGRIKGMYNSTLYMFDIVTKELTKQVFNYDDSFPNFGHVEKEPLISDTNGISAQEESRVIFYPKHKGLFTGVDDSIRASILAAFQSMQIQIVVPGDTGINVGDTCTFRVPSLDENIQQRTEDVLYSGKYLITAIRHCIKKDHHEMVMELSRDSLPNPIEHLTNNTGIASTSSANGGISA